VLNDAAPAGAAPVRVASHQLLLHVLGAAASGNARPGGSQEPTGLLVQSHSDQYSLSDWLYERLPALRKRGKRSQHVTHRPAALFRPTLTGRHDVERVLAALETLADPGATGDQRRTVYEQLTGIDMGRPLHPFRLVALRCNWTV